ncbi:MAG: hypothetical protein KJ630_02735 [Proteobacteria bacterium]|nr:hypothetical protein [Pseudomonadota bacterium]
MDIVGEVISFPQNVPQAPNYRGETIKKLLVSLMVSALVVFGAIQGAIAKEKTLIIGIAEEPAKMNPVLVESKGQDSNKVLTEWVHQLFRKR